MSIWCSYEDIGYDDCAEDPSVPNGGKVLSYASGFSNHYPDETGDFERPASIGLASTAPWCVPGHDEDCAICERAHDYPDCGSWLRIDITCQNALTWWVDNDKTAPQEEWVHASAVIDPNAARALAAELLRWADLPHLQPHEVTT